MKDDDKKLLYCPHCKRQHIDSRWWLYRPHKTHHCLYKDCKKTFDTKDACVGVKTLTPSK